MECKNCNKEIGGRRKLYCSLRCNGSAYYFRNIEKKKAYAEEYARKNLSRDRERNSAYFKKWYQRNKRRQKENNIRSYHKNKSRWNERRFTNYFREEILKLINPLCSCGKQTKMIHHKTYLNYMVLKAEGRKKGFLESYSNNLMGVCSLDCLHKFMRER